jgi:hypothetical protein
VTVATNVYRHRAATMTPTIFQDRIAAPVQASAIRSLLPYLAGRRRREQVGRTSGTEHLGSCRPARTTHTHHVVVAPAPNVPCSETESQTPAMLSQWGGKLTMSTNRRVWVGTSCKRSRRSQLR